MSDLATLTGSGWSITNPLVKKGVSAVLAANAVAAPVTGTVAKTTLAAISIPAGSLGPNGVLRVTALWSTTSNANAKTIGAEFASGGTILNAAAASTASIQTKTILRNRNALNSQVSMTPANTSGAGIDGNAVATFAVDFSVAQTLNFFGTLGNAADTITLEGYIVEVLNP